MSLAIEAERTVVSRLQSMTVRALARNNSSSGVRGLRIEIIQESSWAAHGLPAKFRRAVASVKVSGSELGELQRALDKGAERGRSPAALSDAAQQELRDLIGQGEGTRHEVRVSEGCSETMDVGVITVRHWLQVTLRTPWGTSSPSVTIPLRVLGKEGVQASGGTAPASTQETFSSGEAATAPSHDSPHFAAEGKAQPVAMPANAVAGAFRAPT